MHSGLIDEEVSKWRKKTRINDVNELAVRIVWDNFYTENMKIPAIDSNDWQFNQKRSKRRVFAWPQTGRCVSKTL